MAETVATFFESHGLPKELIIFLISLMPIIELRGGLIVAKLWGIALWKAFPICYVGNALPIPFILLFIKKIFDFLRDKKGFSGLIRRLEKHSQKKGKKLEKGREWGLLAFVAIPLPGTGGWTGSLIAALLEMPIKRSFPIILIGILIAGAAMSILAYALPDLFGFLLGG